jgi:UDP-N-acetylglucosamine diphosphorylase/glucosamine-1-phosphate N-acetyltransferase
LTVNDTPWIRDGVDVLVNARWLPPGRPGPRPQTPHVGLAGGQVAYVVLPPGALADCAPVAVADRVEECRDRLPQCEAGGRMIDYPWHLVEYNGEALEHDFEQRRGGGAGHVQVVGPRERLVVDPGARVDPLVAADTTRGPVLIDRGAVVHPFSFLEGPCYVGQGTSVLGARVRGSTLGPVCRVGGEVETSILQGYSNKAHEGYLGHSYVGEWVNLGAGTQTSDLRNDYGPVSVPVGAQRVNSGLTKVGSFVGDHTKTGLNTLLNTGTTVGPFCHLLPSSALLPKFVPPFCTYWHGQLQDRADLRQLFTTAATVMRRRNQEWTGYHADFFLALYDYTAGQRRQALWESEQRRLRRIV